MPGVPISDSTVVVRVNDVLTKPAGLVDLTGKEITVRLRQPASAQEGQKIIFFTTAWIYGESIAVRETGRIDARLAMADARKQIEQETRKDRDRELQARIEKADLVVSGKVSSVKPAADNARRPVSEHTPDWWVATIKVQSVEKGKLADKTVDVLFPKSTDEMWIDSPKFKAGQEGIWILRKDQTEKGFPATRMRGFTALDRKDFQEPDRVGHIRELVKKAR
jgi:hypothetical protein